MAVAKSSAVAAAADNPAPPGDLSPKIVIGLELDPRDQPRDDATRIATQILQRLPLTRVQHVLRTNPVLRVAEAAVGVSLVGYQFRQTQPTPSTSPVAQVGVHALRYSAAEWLERSRFRIEPEVRPGGVAVYFKRSH
jgi:outer membrane protein TolC